MQALADSEEEREALRAEVEMWPKRFLDLIAARSGDDVLPNAIAAFRDIAAAEDISRDET